MPIVLDETTRAAYLAESLASSRAALVVSALTGIVSVEVRDGSDVLRASGTMAAPWATSSGATITVGQVTGAGITVSSGGVPDAKWYCQFKAGSRFVRGTFGVSTSSADFRWSLATFQTGSRGTLAAVALTATGSGDVAPLLYESNVTGSGRYLGSFRLPDSGLPSPNNFSGSSLRSGGAAAWFNETGGLNGTGSLFVMGRNTNAAGRVAEVSIPNPVNLITTAISGLPRAQFLSASPYFFDLSSGGAQQVLPSGGIDVVSGGFMRYGGNFYQSWGADYQGANTAATTFKKAGESLESGVATGPFAFASNVIDATTSTSPIWHRASYGAIPLEWQTRLGGKVIASYVQYSNPEPIGNGPALFAVDPDLIGVVFPAPSNILAGYSTQNALEVVPRGSQGTNWMRGVSSAYGVFFPTGSGTVVVATKFGEGVRLYGTTGLPDEDFGITIVDPVLPDKGDHAYPYVIRMLAYRATDLEAARNGALAPYQVRPYTQWTVNLPLALGQASSELDGTGTCGVAFDASSNKLYLIERETKRSINDPIVHVYQVSF